MNNSRELVLKATYALPIFKTRWINDVFRTYLDQPQGRANVAALAVGNGEELPHLRFFTGQWRKYSCLRHSSTFSLY